MASLYSYSRPLPYQPIPTYRDCNAKSSLKLDLNSLYIKRPKETFFIKVKNPNLLAWGIELDDLLIVEKETGGFLPNDLIVIEEKRSYKFYQYIGEVPNLRGENEKILMALDKHDKNIAVQHWSEIQISGVITNVVHQMRQRPQCLSNYIQQYVA